MSEVATWQVVWSKIREAIKGKVSEFNSKSGPQFTISRTADLRATGLDAGRCPPLPAILLLVRCDSLELTGRPKPSAILRSRSFRNTFLNLECCLVVGDG